MRQKISVDFQNADTAGRVRLNTVGTEQDIERLGLKLEDGLSLLLFDREREADGEAEWSREENLWVARVDWNAVREIAE